MTQQGMDATGSGLPEFVLPAKDGGWNILLKVQPGARKSEITGVHDGRLKVRLMAPAVENKANKALVAFLADALGVRPARLRLDAGDMSRDKRIHVADGCKPDWKRLLD